MANPSTTGPSGAGTEVLRRAWANGDFATHQKVLDGAADHIYTIISIVIHNTTDADNVHVYIYPDATSGDEIRFIKNVSVAHSGTFVWNDKLVLAGTDELYVKTDSTSDLDVLVSYIDQQF